MDSYNIKKLMSQYLPHREAGRMSGHANVYFHWKLMFGGVLILNTLILFLSLYLFLGINRGDIFLVEQNQEIRIETIDRNMLKDIVAAFETKKTLFESSKLSPPDLPSDPSR